MDGFSHTTKQLTHFRHYLPGDSARSQAKDSVLPDRSSHQTPIPSPGRRLCFSLNYYRPEIPKTSSFSLVEINFIEQLAELREILTGPLVYYKGLQLRIARWERCMGQGMWEGASLPSLSTPLSPNLHVFANPAAPRTHPPFFFLFVEDSLHRHVDEITGHW